MSVFRFKRFEVLNERSAMKVNTDGTILGAVADVFPEDRNVLDIGTGTGTIALMVAQRLSEVSEDYHIDGIDIDLPSAEEAAANFAGSPWGSHMSAVRTSLGSFTSPSEYDLIVSNPPYFDNSLQAPEERRNSARHTGGNDGWPESDSLSYREILEYAQCHLSSSGRVALVLPADQEKALLRYARMCEFSLWKILRVKTVPRKNPSRIVVQFRKRGRVQDAEESVLTIMDEKGNRSSEFGSLMSDYLL